MKTQRQPTGTQHKSTVTLPNDRDVVVVRAFNAPRELVFDAWTKPALVQRWLLGPPGWTMPVCEMDVRPGGKFAGAGAATRTARSSASGASSARSCAPSRLVHVERFDPGDVGGEMGEALDHDRAHGEERRHDAHDDDPLRIERGPRRGPEDRHDGRHGEELPEARRAARGRCRPRRQRQATRGRAWRIWSNVRPAALSV